MHYPLVDIDRSLGGIEGFCALKGQEEYLGKVRIILKDLDISRSEVRMTVTLRSHSLVCFLTMHNDLVM